MGLRAAGVICCRVRVQLSGGCCCFEVAWRGESWHGDGAALLQWLAFGEGLLPVGYERELGGKGRDLFCIACVRVHHPNPPVSVPLLSWRLESGPAAVHGRPAPMGNSEAGDGQTTWTF